MIGDQTSVSNLLEYTVDGLWTGLVESAAPQPLVNTIEFEIP